jgi:transposase
MGEKAAMRPRILKLHHKTVDKLKGLKKEAEQSGAYRVAKRIHAVLLNSGGRTSGEIAELLSAPLSRVSAWLKNYEQHGYEGLLEGYRPGCPSRLTAEQKVVLADIIESGPIAYGYSSGLWTTPMITKIINDEFEVVYHPAHVGKILHQLGFSVQRPKRHLTMADPSQQDRWHRYTYPDLKKKQR